MTAPEPLSAEHRMLVLKAFIGEAEKELAALLKTVAPSYPLPTTVVFESPLDGACLGRITRARSTPEWRVTAPEQLDEYLRAEFPNLIEVVYHLDVPGQDAPVVLPELHPITQALLQTAPDLLTPQDRIPPEVVEAAVEESRSTGQAAAPGIQLVRTRKAALSVVPDKAEAMPAIGRLVAAGRVSWSELVPGSALTALPAAERRAS